MDPGVCDSLSNILGVQPMSKNEKYLGSPLIIGRSKVKAFEDIQLAFERRLGNWQGTTMNQSGRSTMVKTILNSIPMYQMSTFKMPKKLLNKLDSIQRKFLWGFKSNRGINLIAWKNMCLSKDLGGLAFRDLEMLNHALLAKLAWRICHHSDHLLGQFLKAKYYRNEEFLQLHGEKHNSSWVWKGIELGLSIVQQHCCMEVNNGNKTRIWSDKWIIGLNQTVEPLHTSHYQFVFVSELILTNSNEWDLRLLNILFSPDNVERITRMKLSLSEDDILRWSPAKDGLFSVKSTYNKLMERRVQQQVAVCTVPRQVWKALWKVQLPHRVKFFIWKCLKNAVPTRQRLAQFNYLDELHCSVCNFEEESLFHLLLTCSHSKAVWRFLNINIDQVITNCQSIAQWIVSWFVDVRNTNSDERQHWISLLMYGCWVIWKERCECVFQDKSLNPNNTVARINHYMHQLSYNHPTLHIPVVNSMPRSGAQSINSGDIDTFKLFVDASFDHSTDECGTGMVLYTFAGTISGFKGSYATRVKDAETGECMAIMEALSWVKEKGIQKLHVVADAESVVKSITMEESFVSWENRKLIRDIKSMLSSFTSWNFTHVRRDGNCLADAISKKIRREKQYWDEFLSSGICIDSILERCI